MEHIIDIVSLEHLFVVWTGIHSHIQLTMPHRLHIIPISKHDQNGNKKEINIQL